MRTDEHNNPTAFTTAVARDAGLTEHVDYEQGNPFVVPGPHGPITLYTARLLLNPIELTLRVIDHASFYVKQGGQRWSYIAIPRFVWDQMPRELKVRTIGFMYMHEGGTAMKSLFPAA